MLFSHPPYLFQDFSRKAMAFLASDTARKMGFPFALEQMLPCTWKCSDESTFGVSLCVYGCTGHYPFHKGRIGGYFNELSLRAAVHHAHTNIDFGGSHVGYRAGPNGGSFGSIQRPLLPEEHAADCGHLCGVIAPFKTVFDDACENILLFQPEGGRLLISIPNEFLEPSWSSTSVKLLVDIETVTAGIVPYEETKTFSHKLAGRSLFYAHPLFLDGLTEMEVRRFRSPDPQPIGRSLGDSHFRIFDMDAALDDGGLPQERLLAYMNLILSARHAPWQLKAAIVNTNLQYNLLTDSLRMEAFVPYSFATFTGVFIDMYNHEIRNYVNLFQPVGLSIKPAGRTREIEIPPAEIHSIFDALPMAEPVVPLDAVLGYPRPVRMLEQFTFAPR